MRKTGVNLHQKDLYSLPIERSIFWSCIAQPPHTMQPPAMLKMLNKSTTVGYQYPVSTFARTELGTCTKQTQNPLLSLTKLLLSIFTWSFSMYSVAQVDPFEILTGRNVEISGVLFLGEALKHAQEDSYACRTHTNHQLPRPNEILVSSLTCVPARSRRVMVTHGPTNLGVRRQRSCRSGLTTLSRCCRSDDRAWKYNDLECRYDGLKNGRKRDGNFFNVLGCRQIDRYVDK